MVCLQCDADWIEDTIAEKLERIVEEARNNKHHLVEAVTLSV
jgi:hypothetical protein